MSVQAMKQALEALEQLQGGCTDSDDGTVEAITVWCPDVITALRAAIEQAEKQGQSLSIKTWQDRCEEHPDHNGIVTDRMIQARMQEEIDELREAIEQLEEPRQWQGLTDEVIEQSAKPYYKLYGFDVPAFARAIEAKLRERNT